MEQAIENNDVPLVTRLLESGERYPLMLHHAVSINNIDMVRLLLDHGVNINTVNEDNETPLIWAFDEDNLVIIDVVDNNETYQMWALNKDYLDIINLLIDHGANLTIVANDGFRPWDLAVTYGTYELVKKIILLVDAETIRSTCLPDISNLKVIELLVAHGANIHSTNFKGSILYESIDDGRLDVIEWGLKHGLSINEQNEYGGYTPLYWAVKGQKIDTAEWLLRHGADPNIPDAVGIYPLQFAIRHNNTEAGILLLEYGANPDLMPILFNNDDISEFIKMYRLDTIKEPNC